jgi:hypothetical protein
MVIDDNKINRYYFCMLQQSALHSVLVCLQVIQVQQQTRTAGQIHLELQQHQCQ